MVRDTLKFTLFAEDAETKLIIFRIRDVLIVDSLTRKSENIIGQKRLFREEAKALERCLISKRLSDKPRMDLEATLPLSQSQEEATNNKINLLTI